jgi:hypothetical protein
MVRVEVALLPPGVMLAGEKEQLRMLGSPSQDSDTGLVEFPDCIAAVIVTCAD